MARYRRRGAPRSAKRSKKKGGFWKVVGVICFFGLLFAFAVYQFRFGEKTQLSEEASSGVPAGVQVEEVSIALTAPEEVSLRSVSGGSERGIAFRGLKDGRYVHTVVADLPQIDEEQFFYEGWLVRKVPFHYFSTGRMVKNERGEFVLEWQGESGKIYNEYMQVVVTLEPEDGNTDPAGHVLEGEFGK